MNAKKILLPVDFSSGGDVALSMASSLAQGWDATLVILHVEEPPMAYVGGGMYYGAPEPDEAALEGMLGAISPPEKEIEVIRDMVCGDPATAIVEYAKEHEIDLIVMSTHGRTGLSHLLLGSVAEAVVRRAECPVVTVKQPPKDGQPSPAACSKEGAPQTS